MTITVNGKVESLNRKITMLEFLLFKGLNPDKVVVEHNENIVRKDYWGNTTLEDNDTIEIISFVGGG
ncbi:MAG: sulfur carrier protein ThiS [Eubacteriales bacterium]